MKLSFDTDAAIEVIRGRQPQYRSWLQDAQARGASLHLSSIVFHELMFGAMASARPEHHMRLVDLFASQFDVEHWSSADAMAAARIRTDLRRAGTTVGGLDALIAGQAVNGGWLLVTGNVREFYRIKELQILSWADPAGPLDRKALAGQIPRK